MDPRRRRARLGAQLQQELAAVLQELKDPGIGFATVTGVELSPDLKQAKVYVSVLGTVQDQAETARSLERASPYIRHQVADRLQLKRVPSFRFLLGSYDSRLDELFSEIEGERKPEISKPEP